MPFVLDASITACWAFQDEDHPDAAIALARLRSEEALAPSLWWFEVRNILVVNERHGLSVYDAAYLELACRKRFALATLDAGLIRAARAEVLPSMADYSSRR